MRTARCQEPSRVARDFYRAHQSPIQLALLQGAHGDFERPQSRTLFIADGMAGASIMKFLGHAAGTYTG